MTDLLINNPNWQAFASLLEADRGLAQGVLAAVMKNETAGGHPDLVNATSSAGAQGAFQFMPATAKQYNVNVSDAADSTRGAADYLQDLTKKYNDPLLAGAAYNWGPGNLDKAQSAAAGAGLPTDALTLANHGFLPKETAAYVVKLAGSLDAPRSQAFSPEVIAATRQFVVQAVQQGAAPVGIVQQLAKSQVAPMIERLTQAGVSPDEIISQVGGAPLAAVKAAQEKVAAQGFGTNLVKGVANAGHDLSTGIQQVGATLGGDDARLQRLNAQEAARQADPEVQAQADTVGSMLGGGAVKTLPYIAAALMPELSLPAAALTQGAVGAGMGALQPTTGDGQRLKNMATDALLAGGGTAAAGLAGRGAQALAAKALRPSEAAAQLATERAALADKFELTKTPAMLNDRARSVLDAMPAAKAQAEERARAELTQQLLKGVGQAGDELTPEVVAAARKSIYNDADGLLEGVQVPADTTALAPKLNQVVSDYKANTLSAYRSPEVESVVNELLKRVEGGELSASALVQARKNVLGNAFRADGDTRSALHAIGRTLDDHLGSVAPGAKAALDVANERWGKLQVLEKVIEATRGQPTMTVPQLANAVKASSRNLFQAGKAPYQDLADAALKLYGPNTSTNLTSVIAKQLAGHDGLLGGAALLHPTAGVPAFVAKWLAKHLMGKAVQSDNPTVLKLLAGAGQAPSTPTAMNTFIAKALGGAATQGAQ